MPWCLVKAQGQLYLLPLLCSQVLLVDTAWLYKEPTKCNGISVTQGKGKVVPVLLTEHHAMKAYWGV
jgi:hypothetical protein